ncbi:hypothetical protein L2E82_43556 [Cichorium intybus]|uniref:Uncharacterized protein n=1 Tax=Cichorium intybus TaxID=13427 RepID=A0ACB8ZMV5_CICIN|nr:hypothetical protein L2E82_43556 [Cichorium intybus]
MAVSLKFNKFQKKSISLPCRSHPSIFRIEEELNKIKESSSGTKSADDICNHLSQLVKLYHFMDDLLALPGTQNLISENHNTIWIQEIMDRSMKLLDICGIVRDVVLQMEEHARDLQCALRRPKDHTSIELYIANYHSLRKNSKKDAQELIMSLKQSEKLMYIAAVPNNHHLTAVIRVLTEVTEVTASIFESVLKYISGRVLKPNGWPLVFLKLMQIRSGAFKEDEKHEGFINELEAVDVSLLDILRNALLENWGVSHAHLRGCCVAKAE